MVQLNFGNNDNNKPKPIYTRAGWEIPQGVPQRFSQQQLEIRATEVLKMRQNLILGTVSNYPYNCVGLVFASRRAFIDPEHIPKILSDDGYIKVQRSSVNVGDIVVYTNDENEPIHIGVIVSIYAFGEIRTLNVLSKWGRDAEFIHDERNVVSYLGKPTSYWKLGHEQNIY